MVASRSVSLSLCNPVHAMSNLELCVALAREAMGWKCLRDRWDGRYGVAPCVMTALRMNVPDWTNSAKIWRILNPS